MPTNLKKLANNIEERKIREVVVAGGETITVYEANVEDVKFLIDYQSEKFSEGNSTEVEFDGVEIVKLLFPRFTDIEGIEDSNDEEIQYVIDNPSVAYLQVEQVIKTMVAEVFKVIVLSAKSQVAEFDLEVESEKSQSQIFDLAFRSTARDLGVDDILNKLDNQDGELRKALAKSLEKQKDFHQEIQKDVANPPFKPTLLRTKVNVEKELEDTNPYLKATNMLEQYKHQFD